MGGGHVSVPNRVGEVWTYTHDERIVFAVVAEDGEHVTLLLLLSHPNLALPGKVHRIKAKHVLTSELRRVA